MATPTAYENAVAAMLPTPGSGQSLDLWPMSQDTQDDNNNCPEIVGSDGYTWTATGDTAGFGGGRIVAGRNGGIAADITQAANWLLNDSDGNPVVYTQTGGISLGFWIQTSLTTQLGRLLWNGTTGVNGWAILQSDGNGGPGNQISIEFMGVNQNVCGSFPVTPTAIDYYVVVEFGSGTVTLKYRAGATGALVTVGSASTSSMIAPTGQMGAINDGTLGWNGFLAEMWAMVAPPPTDAQLSTQFSAGAILPSVQSHTPLANATGVSTGAVVTMTFSASGGVTKVMDPSTMVFTLKDSLNAIQPVVLTNSGNVATWTPTNGLKGGQAYTATLTSGAAVDVNALAGSTSWSFTTAAAVTPTIASKTPISGDGYVSVDRAVSATFNENIDPTTLVFTLVGPGSVAIPAMLRYNAQTFTATWTPTSAMPAVSLHTATISAASDYNGHSLASPVSWSFTTTTAPDISKPALIWVYSNKSGFKLQPKRQPTTPAANVLGLWTFANYNATANTSADLGSNGYTATFHNAPTLVGNVYFPASVAPQLNGTSQYATIPTLLNVVPTQWTITRQFVLNSAPAAGARIFYKSAGSGDYWDWYFTGGNPGTITISCKANGTVYTVVTPSQPLVDGKPHTVSQTFDGTLLHTWLDGVSIDIRSGGSPQSGGTGNTVLGANATPANYAPITDQLFEVTPRALTQAEIEQRHQQWSGPQNTPASRLKLKATISLPQYGGAMQEGNIVFRNGVYDIFFTGSLYPPVVARISSTDGMNWTDEGIILGSGFGGEYTMAQPYVFQDVDGQRYLYYLPGTGVGNRLFVATSSDGKTFQRYGTVAVASGAANGFANISIARMGSTLYMLASCPTSNYNGIWQTFLLTASDPRGPFTFANGGQPLSSLNPLLGAESGGGTTFPRMVNGAWHTWFHGGTAPQSYANTEIFHYINDSLVTDAWQPAEDTPFMPLDLNGYAQRANPSICYDGSNIFFLDSALLNSSTSSIEIYEAANMTPEQFLGTDSMPGAVASRGSAFLSRSR